MVYREKLLPWNAWKRRLLVFVSLVSAVCITILPLWQKIGVQPTLLLILLYHCSVYRPDLLSIDQLVLVSLIEDGIYAYPLGFSALRLLICYALLMTQTRILSHQRFLWVWGGFGIFALLDALIYATLLSFTKHEWADMLPLIPGILMTISLYPPVIWITNLFILKRMAF